MGGVHAAAGLYALRGREIVLWSGRKSDLMSAIARFS
jgi:hypothetical protein